MATKSNRFGIGRADPIDLVPRRTREVGPMGAAVRKAASSLQASSEAMVEQRRQNAADAKEFRQAEGEGRVLKTVPLVRFPRPTYRVTAWIWPQWHPQTRWKSCRLRSGPGVRKSLSNCFGMAAVSCTSSLVGEGSRRLNGCSQNLATHILARSWLGFLR